MNTLVVLLRGPLKSCVYIHTTDWAAQQRAASLAVLHSCAPAVYDTKARTYTVDATAYYAVR